VWDESYIKFENQSSKLQGDLRSGYDMSINGTDPFAVRPGPFSWRFLKPAAVSNLDALLLQVISGYNVTKFVPFNPVDKKTVAHVTLPNGAKIVTTKGAPQVTLSPPFGNASPSFPWEFNRKKSADDCSLSLLSTGREFAALLNMCFSGKARLGSLL
jgi:hypothetical protein